MRLSRWNSYIAIGKLSGLIYNALTDSFIVIKDNSQDFQLACHGNLDKFSPEFSKLMQQAGALVPKDKDEVAEIRNLIESVDSDDSFLQIIINPTLDCNFHCWYCYESHEKGSCMSAETVNGVVEFVKNKIKTQQSLRYLTLSFFGGEPLMRFSEVVQPLVKRIWELCNDSDIIMDVHFTTNSYLLTDIMIEFLKKYNASFQITLDGGRIYHNKTRFGKDAVASFDTILGNVRKLAEVDCYVTLRINYTTNVIDSTSEIIDIVSTFPDKCRQYINIDFQRVWQDKKDNLQDNTYSKARQMRKQLNKLGFNTPNNRLINYVRNSCYADKDNEFLINFNGDVFACTARDFNRESRLGHLSSSGEITWNDNILNLRKMCKFAKRVCHECRIAPICGGGCRTKCVEEINHDKCNLGYTQQEIDELILERFEDRFIYR